MTVSLVKRPMPQGTIWVCTDCMILDVNGDEPVDPDPTQPLPWALWADAKMGDTTPGITREAHTCDDPDSWERGEDCGCEEREFSWSPCDGCGSSLGGTRHAFTYWA
jgi:hypothetical protein